MRCQHSDPADPALVEATVAALRAAAPRCGRTRVLAIDGPSGSGKTTLARAVVEDLDCPLVTMDELYPGWAGLAAAVPLLDREVLGPISREEQARYRTWDWEHDQWGETKGVGPTDLLVVEGCGSSVRPAGDRAALRLWLDADQATRQRRGLARDGETFAPFWEQWAAQETDLFGRDGTRDRAHLVIDTTPPSGG